jgi:long-chain acyl-CoA synthetase
MTTSSDPRPANIASWVSERAATDPDLPAVKQGETTLSYATLDLATGRFATILHSRGVKSGDRVAMIMPNVA